MGMPGRTVAQVADSKKSNRGDLDTFPAPKWRGLGRLQALPRQVG